MNKIVNFKIGLSIIISSLLVTLSYELKSTFQFEKGLFFAFVITVSFVLSTILIQVISSLLLEIRLIRKIIFGKSDIEGIWEFKTESEVNGDSDLALNNIVKISYQNSENSFKVVGLRKNNHGKEVSSNSELTKYNFTTGKFINVTKVSDSQDGPKTSLTYSDFFSDHTSNRINRFNGWILADNSNGPIKLVRSGMRKR